MPPRGQGGLLIGFLLLPLCVWVTGHALGARSCLVMCSLPCGVRWITPASCSPPQRVHDNQPPLWDARGFQLSLGLGQAVYGCALSLRGDQNDVFLHSPPSRPLPPTRSLWCLQGFFRNITFRPVLPCRERFSTPSDDPRAPTTPQVMSGANNTPGTPCMVGNRPHKAHIVRLSPLLL